MFSFVKTRRTRGTLASLTRSGIWRRKQFCEMAPSSQRGCIRIHTGRICFLCARGSPALLCTLLQQNSPIPGQAAVLLPSGAAPSPMATCPQAPSANQRLGLTLRFPVKLPLPRGPGGGWWLRLNEDFLMSVLRDACLPWAGAAWSLPCYLTAAPLLSSPSTFVLETLLWEGEGGQRGSVAAEFPLSALLGNPHGGQTSHSTPWSGPSNH